MSLTVEGTERKENDMDYILTEKMLGKIKKELGDIQEAKEDISRMKWNESNAYFNEIALTEFEGMEKGIEFVLKTITGKRRG